jgi:ATP-dependent RNA helicase SUPV3L1/SUV3
MAEAPASPPKPTLPAGAFLAGAEMMSLVGCSGEDFDGILKALGFRAVTVSLEDSDPLKAWRPAGRGQAGGRAKRPQSNEPKEPRKNPRKEDNARRNAGPKRADGGGRPQKGGPRKHGKPGGKPPRDAQKPRAPAAREFGPGRSKKGAYDPDSPFAALAQLKDTLKR